MTTFHIRSNPHACAESGNTDPQQEDSLEEAEHVQHDAGTQQQGPVSQAGAQQRVQVTRQQAAHQARHPIQQLQSHYHLHRPQTVPSN